MAGQSKVSDSEILRVFAVAPDPIVTAKELSYNLPITAQAINKRLGRLERDGFIDSRKVGSAAKVYWLTEKGREKLSDEEYQAPDSSDQ
jgi:predicted transcriptional regulator